MAEIRIKPRVKKWLKALPQKHKRQVKDYILQLGESPMRHDTQQLKGNYPFRRGDIGEYRVIYRYEEKNDLVTVVLVGKRNGDEVYKRFKRINQ